MGPAALRVIKDQTNQRIEQPRRTPAGLFCLGAKGEMAMDFSKLDGLIPAVVQDDETNEVLMVGFMNAEALELTRQCGFATFFSRTRNTLWMKGETSGNRLQVRRILTDCDDDTVLLRVTRLGNGQVCHTGARSCFSRDLGV
jgi:phosphoribosyl-ATP pyrophosphohydrolase/phosphoribosyl-AMP cyclohydrolase